MAFGDRNRFRDVLGKGAEELLSENKTFAPTATGALTKYITFGPYDVDLDVHNVVCTSAVPVTAGANTLDLFNNSISANPVITQFDPDTLSAATPATKAVTGNRRLTAGNVLVGRLVVAAADPNEDVNVKVNFERPLHDRSAKNTTYGAY